MRILVKLDEYIVTLKVLLNFVIKEEEILIC